ncbi:glutamate receptor 2.8-like [Senna tora]|uniref:Glutamate receptor 2.8-like n=1 Tax=Senna tora TaxID=362788 RepID=A0A834WSM1_9FABA|nr:glutamate receptor 2.8-like [Senna tora]
MGPNTTTLPVNIGVVLDSDTWIGKLGLSCIHMALSDFYHSHTHYKTRILLNIKHSNTHLISAASAGVEAIIGPQYSKQANFIVDVGNKAEVPILSFSASTPSLNNPPNPYFFRVAQSDAAQVAAIAAIVEAFEWTQVVPIYQEGLYGEEVTISIIKAFQEANVRVPYQTAISSTATDKQIIEQLGKLRMMSNRVFIVHMTPILGFHVFTKAREIGMMEQDYVWIMTTAMTNVLDWTNSSLTDSLQGVLGVATYFPKSRRLQDFEVRWKLKFQQENPSIIGGGLNVLGLWAYDAATALAMAVEKAGISNISFPKPNASDYDTLVVGVSQSGPILRETLSKTTFKGLSGEFSMVNGELKSSTFQIINVVGDGKRVVGFWTPQKGLERKLNHRNVSTYSASKANLGPIIWAGDSSSAPKGWDVAPNGKKLRIGVPVKVETGFNRLVDVHYDSGNKTANFSGYCIDVFKATMAALPYIVPYELAPFERPNRVHDSFHPGRFYDDLIRQVYLGEFDAVVGDLTITFERSLYVDFTFPFTQSGATFMVPTKETNKSKAWVFLKPLTWQLWLTSGCFFVFIGFVVWSYTASFTTLLTVQQLRPAVTDVNQLIQSGDSVGYQFGSYTYNLLKQMGFDDSRLQPYNSPQECDHLLTIGNQNGGISAAFDEIPYINLIQASYCSKYTTIGPAFKSAGFGFAFQRNSPVVTDVSRAILNLTEKNPDIMKAIEHKWFTNETDCVQPSAVDASYSLDLDSFRGLFLIAGMASSSALIIHALNITVPLNVGVLVDADTWIGKLGLSCINMALSDFYNSHTHYKTRILLNIKHSNTDVIAAASAGVEAIIGPQYSRQANFVMDVGNKAEVPIISFSATSPSLNDPHFFRVAQSEGAQVGAIAAIVEAFGWKQVVLIYEEGLYGKEVIPSLIEALQEVDIRVPHQSAISASATEQQIVEELYYLRSNEASRSATPK